MISDTTLAIFVIAFGIALGWVIIDLLWRASRRFRKATRWIGCKCGFHAPSGHFEPAVGGRDVQRCLYCDVVVFEVQRTKGSLRRVK